MAISFSNWRFRSFTAARRSLGTSSICQSSKDLSKGFCGPQRAVDCLRSCSDPLWLPAAVMHSHQHEPVRHAVGGVDEAPQHLGSRGGHHSGDLVQLPLACGVQPEGQHVVHCSTLISGPRPRNTSAAFLYRYGQCSGHFLKGLFAISQPSQSCCAFACRHCQGSLSPPYGGLTPVRRHLAVLGRHRCRVTFSAPRPIRAHGPDGRRLDGLGCCLTITP